LNEIIKIPDARWQYILKEWAWLQK